MMISIYSFFSKCMISLIKADNMFNIFERKGLKIFAGLLTFLTVSNVNSACFLLFGQEKEPDSLKRFKQIK